MRKAFVAFILFTVSMTACKKPEAFEYRDIKNIRIQNWQSEKSDVSMDLVYFNPNNYGVNLKNVSCDIFIDSSYIGKFQLDTVMHINKHAEFTLPARMQVNMKSILNNAMNALLGNPVKIGAKGTSRVGKGGIYVTVPFSYEGMHELNLF